MGTAGIQGPLAHTTFLVQALGELEEGKDLQCPRKKAQGGTHLPQGKGHVHRSLAPDKLAPQEIMVDSRRLD